MTRSRDDSSSSSKRRPSATLSSRRVPVAQGLQGERPRQRQMTRTRSGKEDREGKEAAGGQGPPARRHDAPIRDRPPGQEGGARP
eukprot:6246734-Lingulodinium_polyedra.AAC.1